MLRFTNSPARCREYRETSRRLLTSNALTFESGTAKISINTGGVAYGVVNTRLRLGGAPRGAAGMSAEPLPGDFAINELEIHPSISAERMQSVK